MIRLSDISLPPEHSAHQLPFEDVAESSYYAEAVRWAASQGIAAGYGNGVFGPGDPITREQMAAILYRYAEYKGYDVTGKVDLAQFTDNGEISAWAKAALVRLARAGDGRKGRPVGVAARCVPRCVWRPALLRVLPQKRPGRSPGCKGQRLDAVGLKDEDPQLRVCARPNEKRKSPCAVCAAQGLLICIIGRGPPAPSIDRGELWPWDFP